MSLLYVGLDGGKREGNLALAHELAATTDGEIGFKVNLDHALVWGESYIAAVVALGRPVFVDLKMNNGPRTMSTVVRWLGSLGVTHTDVWAYAESNLTRTLEELAGVTDRPAIFAATFYTRWDEAYAQTHHRMSVDALIGHWARVAVEHGAEGVIVPATRLVALGDLSTVRMSPGIRLPGQRTGSAQQHVATPGEALLAGADILVMGSPIQQAPDPVAALAEVLAAMRRVEAAS